MFSHFTAIKPIKRELRLTKEIQTAEINLFKFKNSLRSHCVSPFHFSTSCKHSNAQNINSHVSYNTRSHKLMLSMFTMLLCFLCSMFYQLFGCCAPHVAFPPMLSSMKMRILLYFSSTISSHCYYSHPISHPKNIFICLLF